MKKKNKRGLIACGLLFCALLGCYAAGRGNENTLAAAGSSGDIIRLHIIAASDSAKDQEMKLKVRDAVIEEFSKEMQAVKSARAAEAVIRENTARLEGAARRAGHSGKVSIEISDFEFPDRVYSGTLLPSGEYRAVRIVLGEGKGENWWCVMYPPLCFVGEDVAIWDTPKVKFESLLVRLINKLRAGKAKGEGI